MRSLIINLFLILIIIAAGYFLYQHFINFNSRKILELFNSEQGIDEFIVVLESTYVETVFADAPDPIYLPGEIDTVYVTETGTFEKWVRTIYESPHKFIGGALHIGYNFLKNEFEMQDSLFVIKETHKIIVKPKENMFKLGAGGGIIGKSVFELHGVIMFKRKFVLEFGGTSGKKLSFSGTYFH